MRILDAQYAAHTNSFKKGFWDGVDTENLDVLGNKLALIHSEVSEALEDLRNGHAPTEVWYENGTKPCGFPSELADIIIRTLDLSAAVGINIEDIIKEKMEYNATRPPMHGKKF